MSDDQSGFVFNTQNGIEFKEDYGPMPWRLQIASQVFSHLSANNSFIADFTKKSHEPLTKYCLRSADLMITHHKETESK